jgi:DNA modification methylase
VAQRLGRRWLGIELSQEYANNIRQRLSSRNLFDDGETEPVAS